MTYSDFTAQAESDRIVLPSFHNERLAYAIWMSFGARLAAARKDAGMTQTELGKGLGTDGSDASKSVVYGWEKDQHYPRVDQLMVICRKLGCSSDYLLFGEERIVSPRVQAARKAVSELSDEERLALLAAIQQEPIPDHVVAKRLPLPPASKTIERLRDARPQVGKKVTKKSA